jgi:hypothetical protein
MSKFVDPEKKWNATILIGTQEVSLTLFDAVEGVRLKSDFGEILKKLLNENQHYMAGKMLKTLTSPTGENFLRGDMFLLVIMFAKMAEKLFGSVHNLLFSILDDGNIEFVGSNYKDMTERTLFQVLDIVREKPEDVKALIIATA